MNEMRDSGISTKMVSVPKGDPRGENSKPIKRGEGGVPWDINGRTC